MCLAQVLFFSITFGLGYTDHGAHGWWGSHDSQCPSYDSKTHECYELVELQLSCLTYEIDCCEYDTSHAINGYCRLCMNVLSRPCVDYRCMRLGCCNGWFEDKSGKCTIPEEEAVIECQNGGIRHENNTCQCVGQFTGNKCQKPICDPPCLNDGQCELVAEKPVCVCPSRYFVGTCCENVHCDQPCLNGGHCVKDGVVASCQCNYGYRGPACEVLTSDMCPIMPDDLATSDCAHVNNQCLNNDECPGDYVCCWDGCGGVCRKPDEMKCYYDNHVFSIAETFKKDDCTVCVCQPQGEMKCEQITCEQLSCPGTDAPLPIPGKCCPKCPGTEPPFMPRAPQFINCPLHYIEAYVGKTNRVANLGNLSLIAEDYEGKHLSVFYSQTQFLHSLQTDIRTNTHIIYAYSEADKYGRRAECHVKVIVRDVQSPRFPSCPYDQWAQDNEEVRWVPPVPTDNVGIYRLAVVGGDHMNKTLRAGAYAVSYTALDFDMNQAICSFVINVFKTNKYWPANTYTDEFPSGTIVGMTTGFVLVTFFSIWVCVRVRQNQKAEAAERDAETNTIASTADSGTTSTVYAMAGRVADMFPVDDGAPKNGGTDVRMKDIKLPEYSPPSAPPRYEDLPESDRHLGQASLSPIYETIPSRAGSDACLVQEAPRYENMVENIGYENTAGEVGYENTAGEVGYENVGAGAENPAYANAHE